MERRRHEQGFLQNEEDAHRYSKIANSVQLNNEMAWYLRQQYQGGFVLTEVLNAEQVCFILNIERGHLRYLVKKHYVKPFAAMPKSIFGEIVKLFRIRDGQKFIMPQGVTMDVTSLLRENRFRSIRITRLDIDRIFFAPAQLDEIYNQFILTRNFYGVNGAKTRKIIQVFDNFSREYAAKNKLE